MKDQYFVISNDDGDTSVDTFTKEQLLKAIQENYWGKKIIFSELPKEDSDPNFWGEAILIIKGSVVTPVAKQVITKYDIE